MIACCFPIHKFTRPDGTEAQASFTLARDGTALIHEVLDGQGRDINLDADEIGDLSLDIECSAVMADLGV